MAYNEYVELYLPNHPEARSNGRVAEHRLVAEKTIGRRLSSEEHVHHVNGQKKDNRPENLWVFRTKADHTRFHQTGVYELMDDGTFISPPQLYEKTCPVCGKVHLTNRKDEVYCSVECKGFANRKVKDRPTKSELKNLLVTNSYADIGRMYGVKSDTIRYWCKHYNILQYKNSIEKLRKKNGCYFDMNNIPIYMKLSTNHKKYKFENMDEAIKYIRYKKLTEVSDRIIYDSILRVIHGKRKTYLNREWLSPEYNAEVERIAQLKKEANTKHLMKQMDKRISD